MAAQADRPRFVVDQPGSNLLLDMFVLDQRVNAMLKVALAPHDVTPAQYAVYSQIGRGASTPTELITVLGLSAGTLSGYLAVLEKREHLMRARSPEDGRSYELTLTAAGERTRTKCAESIKEVVRRLDRSLGGAQIRDEIRRSLGLLHEAISITERSLLPDRHT